MTDNRTPVLPLVALALAVTLAGCTRGQARREQVREPRAIPSEPSQDYARQPVAAPMPPAPPPLPQPPVEPSPAPPRADAVAGIVPPMPDGEPSPLAMTDGAVQPAALMSEADRERRQDRRERRQDRREQRQEQRIPPQPQPTTPPAPASEPLPPPPPADTDSPRPPATRPPASPAPATPAPPPATGMPSTPPASTIPTPPPATVADSPATPAGGDSLAAVRKLVESSVQRYAALPDFEAHLVKQEVVRGRPQPRSEIAYRFRTKPLSIYMKTLSEEGQGREVLYVQGQHGDKIHLVTGKGDNRLVGAGFKTELDKDDSRITSKSRHRVEDAGFGRTLGGLQKAVATAGNKGGYEVKALGQVKRAEYPYPLEGVEISTNNAGSDVIPGGGTRQVYFDPKTDSPSYMLPVLVITKDLNSREVEYYSFTRFKAPANTTDADWNPSRLGK